MTLLAKHLADKILTSRVALEGERKQVTVLFADVKGSMELAEELDPEEWHTILDRFFKILTDAVHRFEGTVNQYTGDGIMALFGAPIAHEDHPQRAYYAALHLRDELRRFAQELRRERGLDVSTRIGINSGEVVVGKIGDDLRMDYTARGHTVGLAQRMEALAEAGKIYLTAATAQRIEGFFALEDLGEFNVKGATAPVRAYALEGLGRLRTRFDRSRARGLSRFVGRDDEMRLLESALARAEHGDGQVIAVVAPAGTGKSRLCFELVERCRAKRLAVIEAQAVAHGRSIPLRPLLEMFRQRFGITEGDSDLAAREKIAGRTPRRSSARCVPLRSIPTWRRSGPSVPAGAETKWHGEPSSRRRTASSPRRARRGMRCASHACFRSTPREPPRNGRAGAHLPGAPSARIPAPPATTSLNQLGEDGTRCLLATERGGPITHLCARSTRQFCA